MVGSRFTSAAEQNYSTVEGELQGVVDGLHKTRYYTQGCDKLLVGVDHKQLLGLLHGKRLESMDNMRLRRLVEKTYGWNFKVVHIPGRKHAVPDAMSRRGSVNTMDIQKPKAREQALRPSGKGAQEQWSANARNPPFLKVGDDVLIQNQRGNYPK